MRDDDAVTNDNVIPTARSGVEGSAVCTLRSTGDEPQIPPLGLKPSVGMTSDKGLRSASGRDDNLFKRTSAKRRLLRANAKCKVLSAKCPTLSATADRSTARNSLLIASCSRQFPLSCLHRL